MKHVWQRLPSPAFGLAGTISREIAKFEWTAPGVLPNLRSGREFICGSDYAGSHKVSRYESFAFVVFAGGGRGRWEQARLQLRAGELGPNREMSFKQLRHGARKRALPAFLAAADLLEGLVLIVLVDKQLPRLIGDPGDPARLPEMVVAKRGWNLKSFDRLSLVCSFLAMLIAGLSDEAQDLLWITDQDEIAPNPAKHDHAGNVAWLHISRYAPKNHRQFVFITTEVDSRIGNMRHEDIVAIPDLAAGALTAALSSVATSELRVSERLAVPVGVDLPECAVEILSWLSVQSSLRRLVVVLDHVDAESSPAVIVGRPSLHSGSLLVQHPTVSGGKYFAVE